MTPEEKALQIYQHFKHCIAVNTKTYYHQTAKECSILLCNEMIDSYKDIYDDFIQNIETYPGFSNMLKYWIMVKEHVLKL